MIRLLVDEAYAFDYLSILELKLNINKINKQEVDKIQENIKEQIGEDLFYEIIKSNHYKKLLEANLKTFEAVDKAKTDEVPASTVDKCNYKRMIAKKELQKKYFNSNLTEAKIGYEKYNVT